MINPYQTPATKASAEYRRWFMSAVVIVAVSYFPLINCPKWMPADWLAVCPIALPTIIFLLFFELEKHATAISAFFMLLYLGAIFALAYRTNFSGSKIAIAAVLLFVWSSLQWALFIKIASGLNSI
jgi:hypothetical protein